MRTRSLPEMKINKMPNKRETNYTSQIALQSLDIENCRIPLNAGDTEARNDAK